MADPVMTVKPTTRKNRAPKPAATFNLYGNGPLLPGSQPTVQSSTGTPNLAPPQVQHNTPPQTRSPANNVQQAQFGKHAAKPGKHAKPVQPGYPNPQGKHQKPAQFGQQGKHAKMAPQNVNKVTGTAGQGTTYVGKHSASGQAQAAAQAKKAAPGNTNKKKSTAGHKNKNGIVQALNHIMGNGKHYMEYVRGMKGTRTIHGA